MNVLAEKFPAWSPYHYAYDNPVRFVDLDGREPSDIIFVSKNGGGIKTSSFQNITNINLPIGTDHTNMDNSLAPYISPMLNHMNKGTNPVSLMNNIDLNKMRILNNGDLNKELIWTFSFV